MKGWLDKYEYGGQAGYTDVPFKYNSAWGGQFQMGGSLPGAVGFTYARTGGIPSNGPYAKKTKASAQDGITAENDPDVSKAREEMIDFYSNRPANLSGDIAANAVKDVKVEEVPLKRLNRREAYAFFNPFTNTIGYNTETQPVTLGDEYDKLETLEHEFGHGAFKKLPKSEKNIISESKVTPEEYLSNYEEGTMPMKWAKYVNKDSEFYTRRNKMFDLFDIDPSQPISDEKAQEMIDFRTFTGTSISPEEKERLLKAHPNFQKYFEKYDKSKSKNEIEDFMETIKNDVPTYKRVFNEVTAIPGEQAPVAQNGMSYYQHGLDWQPKTISKNGGWLDRYTPKAQVGEIVGPYQSAANSNDVKISLVPTLGQTTSEVAPSGFNYEDYYNKAGKYLSRPTFKNTELKPEHIAKSAQEFYEKTGYEYPLDLLLTQAQMETGLGTKLKSKHNYFNVGNTDSGAVKNYETPQQSLLEYMGVMYNDYLQKGKKKVTDLLKPKGFVNYAGNRYASAPDYEKKLLTQKNFIAKKLSLKKGGVIKDDRGQWAHPGEITEIGSNQITMQGVPYPVLGISDAGDTQVMYPEQEYKFKGKKVTEIPLNKKSTGGWLDKYN